MARLLRGTLHQQGSLLDDAAVETTLSLGEAMGDPSWICTYIQEHIYIYNLSISVYIYIYILYKYMYMYVYVYIYIHYIYIYMYTQM